MSETSDSTAWGRGVATIAADGTVLDTWFPQLGLGTAPAPAPAGSDDLAALVGSDAIRDVTTSMVELEIDLDAPPTNASDVYLRLHLLSNRLRRPRTINLDGQFGLLTNVAWTNLGPVAVATLDAVQMRARIAGVAFGVHSVDKFPRA